MTALVVAKYGSFNQGVILTNLAYDIALSIRTAQSYGISVKVADPGSDTADFNAAYGLFFSSGSNLSNQYIFFSDGNSTIAPDAYLTWNGSDVNTIGGGDAFISKYLFKRGTKIFRLVYPPYTSSTVNQAIITFQRPDPTAHITTVSGGVLTYNRSGIEIDISSADGLSTRAVVVYQNGLITVVGQ
jgi:hypothetical protein